MARALLWGVLWGASLGVSAAVAAAAEPLADLRAGDALANDAGWWRAERLVRDGRCPSALPLLDEVEARYPTEARVFLAQGRCLLLLLRYDEAVEALEAARAADPTLAEVHLPLAVAYLNRGDLDASDAALARAEALDPDDAETQLYRGLLHLQRGDASAAASVLARARSGDSDAVHPVASFYEARALRVARDSSAAREALRRVVDDYPGTPWAERAQQELDALARTRLRTWAWLTAGWEYDDNVVLRGSGVVLPAEISGARDTRILWNGGAGGELELTPELRWGGLLAYEGTAHRELDEFDYHYPSLSTWLDRRLAGGFVARARADLAYAWVDGRPYLGYQRYDASLLRSWDRWGTSQAGGHYARFDYFFRIDDVPDGPGRPGAFCLDPDDIVCAPPGIDESDERSRDGDEWGLAVDHTLPLGLADWSLQAGYRYRHFDSEGSEFAHNAHEVLATLRGTLPGGFRLRVAGSYTHRPFRNASTFPDPDGLVFNLQYALSRDHRVDDDFRVEVGLERDVHRYVTLAARWTYRRNQSNVRVFDYHRNILGVYVTVAAGD